MANGQPIPLKFNPQVVKDSTRRSAEMDYFDCNNVRFVGGLPQSIGGWERLTDEAMLGTPRSIFAWSTFAGEDLMGVGTHWKYYVYDGGSLEDVTPFRSEDVDPGTDVLDATIGESTITVNHTSHGASLDDFVHIAGATTFAGISDTILNDEHQIIQVIDADSYVIDVGFDATSTASGGGSSLLLSYHIQGGQDSVILGAGYGAGPYSRNGYGEAADTILAGGQLRVWTEDAWGEDLLINPRGGAIYYYDSSAGGNAIALQSLPGANEVPVVADQILVSPEEQTALAFGCNKIGQSTADPLFVRYSDRELITEWEPTELTTAGGFRLTAGSKHMIALKIRQGIAEFTNKALYVIQFVGEGGYAPRLISDNISILGPKAAKTLNGVVYWMATRGCGMYDGTPRELPTPMTQYIYNDMNMAQSWKCHVGVNPLFSEVWFFWVSKDSEEIDRYVIYNTTSKAWTPGYMSRLAYLESGVYQRPRAVTADGYIMEHESGLNDGSSDTPAPLESYIESNIFTLENGKNQFRLRWMYPDIDFLNSTAANPAVTVKFRLQDKMGSASELEEIGETVRTFEGTIEQFTEKLDIGKRARYIALRLECDTLDTAWRMGVNSLDVKMDGQR